MDKKMLISRFSLVSEKEKTNHFIQTLLDIKEDINRYTLRDERSKLTIFLLLFFNLGLWVSVQYRFSRWVKNYCHVPILRQVLSIFCFLSRVFVFALTNCDFPHEAEIGKGVFLPHPTGIIIHLEAKIGENCNLGQHTTIGIGGRDDKKGVPVIGDRVVIFAGACLFGKITVGNDAVIGANAVVNKDIPDKAIAAGVPAKILSYQGSHDLL